MRWQALSRDAFLVKDENFKYENRFHWTNPRALRALGTQGSPSGPPGLRARNSPGAHASALKINHTKVVFQLVLLKASHMISMIVQIADRN